jgi:hypothetical protein
MVEKNKSNSERERRWRAEEDARTLAAYQEIVSDPKRVKYAAKVAQKQADELTKRANAMKKVANKGKK